jgi:hypothetical protein
MDASAESTRPLGEGMGTAWHGLAVLVVATIFGAVDRQILVLLAEPVRRTLGLSDTSLGMIQGIGITLFAGIAAVPVGWLSGDRSSHAVSQHAHGPRGLPQPAGLAELRGLRVRRWLRDDGLLRHHRIGTILRGRTSCTVLPVRSGSTWAC